MNSHNPGSGEGNKTGGPSGRTTIKRVLLVVISATLFLAISLTFLNLTKLLTRPFSIGLTKPSIVTYGENPLYIISQSTSDTIVKLEQYLKKVIYEDRVNILGNSLLSKDVTLLVNRRQINKIRPDQNSRFEFSDVKLGRGENEIRIEQQEPSDYKIYNIVVKDSIVQEPGIISYHLTKDSSRLDIMGIGEAATRYDIHLGGYIIPVETDNWGTFCRTILTDTIRRIFSENESQINLKAEYSILHELPPIILNRKFEVFPDSSGKYTRADLYVQLPESCLLYKNLNMGLISRQNFINRTFGNIGLDWVVKSARIVSDSSLVKIYFNLVREDWMTINFNSFRENSIFQIYRGETKISGSPLFSSGDSLIFHLSDTVFYSSSLPADVSGENIKIFTGYKEFSGPEGFRLTVNDNPDFRDPFVDDFRKAYEKPTVLSEPDPLPNNYIVLIRQLPVKVFKLGVFKKLSPLFDGLFYSIPLLWLFWLLKKHRDRFGNYYQRFLTILLISLFFYYFGYLTQTIYDLINPGITLLLRNLHAYQVSNTSYLDFTILAILLFGAVIASLIPQYNELSPVKIKGNFISLLTWTGSLLFILTCGYLCSSLFYDLRIFPAGLTVLFGFTVGIIIITTVLIILVMLLQSVLRNTLNISLKLSYLLGPIVFLLIYTQLFDSLNLVMDKYLVRLLWTIFAGLIGTAFFVSFFKLCLLVFPDRIVILKKRTWLLLVICFALLVIPKKIIFMPESIYYDFAVGNIYYYISDLFKFVVLLIVLVFLFYDNKAERIHLNRLTADLAILLLAVYVVDFGYYWFYIPITLIIAYFFSKGILIQNPDRINDQLEKYASVLGSRRESIQKVINYLSFKRQFKAIKKAFDKKLSQGDIDYAAWNKKNTENQAQLSALKSDAQFQEADLRNVIFSFNNDPSPWNSAIQTAKIGALLAIPLIFVVIRDFRMFRPNVDYPLLSIIDILLKKISLWIVLAFSFGYFYNLIKGRTGIEKALWISLMILLARIGPAIFFADTLKDIVFLLTLGVEIIIYCLLLGFFAFDFQILRKNGYGWGEVEVIYNIAFLSTFGSTLLVALAGIISGKLPELFSWLLKSLFAGG